jgi:cytidylate kinase
MSIIMISRGMYTMGREVAEKVAKRVDYECISREITLETSKEFDIPEIKLLHVFQNAPSFWDRFLAHQKKKYLAYLEGTLLKRFESDNVVFHGFGGRLFLLLKGVSHVLRVRVIADLEDRAEAMSAREKVSKEEAVLALTKLDEQRRKWIHTLYGFDPWDSQLYDVVLHINRITLEDAADNICRLVALKQFQTTPESREMLDDVTLTARVKTALIDSKQVVDVKCEKGMVYVKVKPIITQTSELLEEIRKLTKGIPGIEEINLDIESASSLGI